MEIYNVKTREDYDELMVKLEEKGYKWLSGKKPTSKNYWIVYKEKSCINISSKYITFMNIEQSKKQYPIIPIIEYKAKGETMKVYHVETKKDWKALMVELEVKGCKWRNGKKPTHFDIFKDEGKDTHIYEESGVLSFSDGEYFKKYHSYETLIEYKAKGDNNENLPR